MRIFCEGQDDQIFITKFLQDLANKGEIDSKPKYIKYIENMVCKSQLLKADNYDNITTDITAGKISKVLFIFDADFSEDGRCNGLEESKQCIENLIDELNWNIEPDYYIFDKNLDDFILKTLSEDQQKCFQEFDECLEIEDRNKNKKISTCIYKKLYPQAPYDFSHQNFNELKQKLINLF